MVKSECSEFFNYTLMKITIGNREIETFEGKSVLEAALEAGIYIPHLCSHPDLTPVGGCRLCSVEIEGVEQPVPSCMTKVKDGMIVTINSPKAEKTRRMAMELILSSHPIDCTGCPKYGKCELQSMYQYMGVSPERWRLKSRSVPTDESNPLIKHLFTRCVRCGRCVRVCRELRGVEVLDFQRINGEVRIGIDGGKSLKDAGCRFCGACIEVCPTGSIMDATGLIPEDMPYAKAVVSCRTKCPAEIDVPRYIRYIKDGNFTAATAVIRERVPFPLVLGIVCNHVCETICKRNELGEPISICKLKRAAAENDDGTWKNKVRKSPPTGKKVGIIGSGPAGLTCAYYLAGKGHSVTVYEAGSKAGGQCRVGIPAYRLPDIYLDKEIDDILSEGIELILNKRIDIPGELLDQGFDAVLVATGTHKGIILPIEGSDLPGVLLNTDFLKNVRLGKPPAIGRRIMVLGGGNVGYDCARTALRLGADEVHIACLENTEQMTSDPEEIEEGEKEGVILHAACSFPKIIGKDKVEGVELKRVSCFEFDENQKAIIKCIEGSEHIISVDNVIFAVGQKPEGTDRMGLPLIADTYIATDEELGAGKPGVFAAGDVVTGTKSVIDAIVGGRKAAESIDKYLGGNGDISEVLTEEMEAPSFIGRSEDFADLPRNYPEKSEPDKNVKCFDLIEEPFMKNEAMLEAERCLQCDLRLNIRNPKFWNDNEYKN